MSTFDDAHGRAETLVLEEIDLMRVANASEYQRFMTSRIGIPSKLEGKWGYYLKINNLLLRIYANSVLNHTIGVNLNLKSIRKCY